MKRMIFFILFFFLIYTGSVHSREAADFKLKDLDGKEVSLNDFKGTVILVNFWATWCGPCIHEMPALEKLFQNYKEDVQVLGLTIASKKEQVPGKVKETGVTYPILLDADKVVADYGSFNSIPQTFIIDREGNIVKQITGARDYETFEAEVRKLIE